MTAPDWLRRLLRGHGPAGPLLAAAADVGLRIEATGPTPAPSVPAFCGSSAHIGLIEPATIPGWKAGVALMAINGPPRNPRTAYCLRCAVLAYIGGAFMPDSFDMPVVLAEVERLTHAAPREPR